MDQDRREKALQDPSSVYAEPAEILADDRLAREEKIEILRRWEYDAREISVAEEEGLPVGNGENLKKILLALQELVGEIDPQETAPTKQGGLVRDAVTPAQPVQEES
ncbi:hypothetical protein [Phaeobacter sp. B1627]|uniref:hypothetical protein n=1 Tax=Phaeobacter sp. B1627 TaxID=2583809 RepID=UPI001119DCFC|nr:hypothetical protein [Phaeobacter sp. B1627]TNJ40812.1 hypothetical protein FGE21_16380 [Phaeobacter sp. B1627]